LQTKKIDRSRNNLDVHIYTDASKTPDGRTNAAFCIPKIDFKCGVRLTDNITIFTAELTAIKLALMWILENRDKVISRRSISLYSDSLSAVQAIKNERTDCRPNMLNEIYEHVNNIENNITITITTTWIPSHVGIKGNEMADRIAQHATSNENVQLDIG